MSGGVEFLVPCFLPKKELSDEAKTGGRVFAAIDHGQYPPKQPNALIGSYLLGIVG